MVDQPNSESYPDLLKKAFHAFMALIRVDVQLARLEFHEKASALGRSGAFLGGSAIFALIGAFGLMEGLIALFVAMGLSPVLAPFLAAVVFFAIAGALFSLGRAAVKNWSLLPQRAIANVREDMQALKEGVANASR